MRGPAFTLGGLLFWDMSFMSASSFQGALNFKHPFPAELRFKVQWLRV